MSLRAALVIALCLVASSVSARRLRTPRPRPASEPRLAPAHAYVDGLSEIAASYSRLKNWDKAVALLDQVRATRPNDPDVLDDLIGACLRSAPCAPRRLALLREGAAKLPQAAELLEELVQELKRKGQPLAALTELRGFVRRHPENDDARALLIDSALDQGQLDVALGELRVHIARNPGELDRQLLYVETLRDAHRAGEFKRELAAFLRKHPDHVGGRVVRGEAAIEAGDLAAAERELARARGLAIRNRDTTLRICVDEADAACVAELKEDLERVDELGAEIAQAQKEHYREFRSDVAWLDLAEDLEREQDREP